MKHSNSNLVFPEGRWLKRIFITLFALMALTGFAQMPIFKRYYIADIPGLGWLARFYTTHFIHYLGAAFLLALFAYLTVAWFMALRHRYQLTWSARFRIGLLALIAGTGVVRVLKNLPNVLFSPGVTMFVDISHLVFMMLFLLFAAVFTMTKSRWVTEKNTFPIK